MEELEVLLLKRVSGIECMRDGLMICHNGMFATVDGWGTLDKQCDVNMAEWDKDLMVLRLFSGGDRGATV